MTTWHKFDSSPPVDEHDVMVVDVLKGDVLWFLS